MDDDLRELEALLDYLVKHNEDHAGELQDLASRAQTLGKTEAYDRLTEGVVLLRDSNVSLRKALDALRG